MMRTSVLVTAALLLTSACGCITTNDKSRADLRQKEDLQILREDLIQVQGRIEGLELEYQRMLSEIEKMRNALSQIGGQAGGAQRRLDELERGLLELNAAREKDREIIIDQVSTKIADMLSRPGASGSGSRSAVTGATGYEHIVQAGETLSEIATAYKVKASVIIEANDLKNPDKLKQGQKLFIPQ